MSVAEAFFVDSNLLLYYVDPSENLKNAGAVEWLNTLWLTGLGRLSWQVLHEFYWNAVKKMQLDRAKAREIVEDLSWWRPVDTSIGLVEQAWHWSDVAQLSYWDALILAAAQRSGAAYLLTEDLQSDRTYGSVRVLDPFKHPPSDFGL